jgi:hypothetical protein
MAAVHCHHSQHDDEAYEQDCGACTADARPFLLNSHLKENKVSENTQVFAPLAAIKSTLPRKKTDRRKRTPAATGAILGPIL